MAIKGQCHCGAVTYHFNDQPKSATKCNCSICRRLGAIWIYSAISNITIEVAPNATLRYMRADKNLAFHTCSTCGTTTHWENLRDAETGKMAVNLLLADPSVVKTIPVRNFDGADTWKFFD